MNEFLEVRAPTAFPPLISRVSIDLTYRCNNRCRHCWLRIPPQGPQRRKELSCSEIRRIVREAQQSGCRQWEISGGEPLLRPDFEDIFDVVLAHARAYTLCTNGTLITPKIASRLKAKGVKNIALYGATAQVHDDVTRVPGSFEALIRGCSYLKEAGAGFSFRAVPMRANYHQCRQMIALAEKFNTKCFFSTAFLHLSASGEEETNRDIVQQRLSAREILAMDGHDPFFVGAESHSLCAEKGRAPGEHCFGREGGVHIDPYGQMTTCGFVRYPGFRYDLRQGSVAECWEKFIPSLALKMRRQKPWPFCRSCRDRDDCSSCPGIMYLEKHSWQKKPQYFCDRAKERREMRELWEKEHRRFYKVGGVTVQVDSDLPIGEHTFNKKFKVFEIRVPGKDLIRIRHRFSRENLLLENMGTRVYQKDNWEVFRKGTLWVYVIRDEKKEITSISSFNQDYTEATIFHENGDFFSNGGWESLTLLPSDQVLLAPVFADRQACILHSSGVILNKKGFLFAGHSAAGKSTITTMLQAQGEVLCDDRNVVRKSRGRFRVYGTWSHGTVPDVSGNSAPLEGIFFLEKSSENKVLHMSNLSEIRSRLFSVLVRGVLGKPGWEKTLALIDEIAMKIPCYVLRFDKSGKIVRSLIKF